MAALSCRVDYLVIEAMVLNKDFGFVKACEGC